VTELRPLRPDDVEAADVVGFTALSQMAATYEDGPFEPRTPDDVARAHSRIAHLQSTDPDGTWVAVDGDEIVGLALAMRRGPVWFLSLLAVATTQQGKGVGRQLLEAALTTAEDAGTVFLCASPDPKALRRYASAGFRLHPGYVATGPVDRSALPAELGIRDGDWSSDRELVDDVGRTLRGAGYGVDLPAMEAVGALLLVAEDGADRGFCIRRSGAIVSVGATTPQLAQRLLWRALADDESPKVTVDWLTGQQQWAIDVVLAAGLSLAPQPSVCIRSAVGPMTPYLPSGIYG
jgi:GNAT superfamily N-acetyltransferase